MTKGELKLEAEVIRLQGELIEMSKDVDYWHGAYDTVYDQAMELRQVVKEYREQCMNGMLTDCDTCQRADALLAPKVTGDKLSKEAL